MIAPDPQDEREMRRTLVGVRRLVVKVGTRVLVRRDGHPNERRLEALVADLCELHAAGLDLALVSSGAVGAGMQALGRRTRPRALPDLQMAAAVGQSRLMARYDRLFGAHGVHVGQVLLTHDGLRHRERHLNARHTLLNLLRHRIVPVINENDTVAVEEIRFGDNDALAALVAVLLESDLLVLLTSVDGLRAPAGGGRTRRVSWLPEVTPEALALARGPGGDLSVGGMISKLQAAQMAAGVGIPVVLADGRKRGVLQKILLEGAPSGTLIGQPREAARSTLSRRRRWIAFFHKCQGTLVVDDGAGRALLEKGKSLLPIGIRAVEGQFGAGAVVHVRDVRGRLLARGQVEYGADQIRAIRGRRSSEIAGVLGVKGMDEVIHRDNLAVLAEREGNFI